MGEIVKVVTESENAFASQPEAKSPRRPKMPKWELDARDALKAGLRKFSKALHDLAARDANEADTRLFVTDFLCEALGFDKYTELTTEYRVKNEYVDYGIRVDKDFLAFIEVKRINTALGAKHLRQAQSYAVNEGVEWIILTNGAQWQVYHLGDKVPIVTDLALEVDILGEASPQHKANDLFFLTREAMKRGKLEGLWQAKRATSPRSLAGILLSPAVVAAIRKELRKTTGYNVDVAEIKRLVEATCLRGECLGK